MEFRAEFERHLRDAELAPATIINHLADVRKFRRWLSQRKGTSFPACGLSSEDLQQYCAYLLEAEGHAGTTVSRYLCSIGRFCRFVLAIGVRLPRRPKRLSPRALNSAEVQRLLQAARAERSMFAERDYAIIQMLLQTGMRVGE